MVINTISKDGMGFLKQKEGSKLTAYLDQAGVPTIGYGSLYLINGKKVRLGDKISQSNADYMLMIECNAIARKLEGMIPLDLTQCQLDALISFCYNVGTYAFKNSTLRQLIMENANEDKIKAEFMRWNKIHRDGKLIVSKGLANRRRAEADMYFSC